MRMQSIRTVLTIALVCATLALPFWGVLGFLLVGATAATAGFAWVVVAPIFWR